MSVFGPRPGGAVGRAGWALAGAALVLTGLAGAAPAAGSGTVLARLGPITVSATALRPGQAGTLTASVQVSTSGQPSDQLDAAIAADGAPVGVYHQRVNVGELPDLAGCGAETPTPAVVDRWLHYGPLLVPGRSGGASPPAVATLTVAPGSALAPGAALAITLYFAHAGSVLLRLPVSQVLPAQLLGGGIGRPVSQEIGASASAAVQVLASGWLRLARPWALRKRRRAGATGAPDAFGPPTTTKRTRPEASR